jgi:gluconate 2-dehydrogenase gamma chain
MTHELVFFNVAEARDVEAMAARIVPGESRDPGAREAGVLAYIDRSVEGAYRELQSSYRRGLAALQRACEERHGAAFADLAEERQDEFLGELDEALFLHETGERDIDDAQLLMLAGLFGMVRQHTLEGLLGDPAYGGNRDAAGWRLVGFPGAQWGYSSEQMQPGFDATSIPVKSLADLREEWS